MKNSIVTHCVVAIAAITSTSAGCGPPPRGPVDRPVALCQVLQGVQPGERIPVRIGGIYVVGYEHQVLYDPKQPSCNANIQPATWVEFATGAARDEGLERLLRESGRALVTFDGELYGPGAVGPDNLSLAPNVAFANRVAASRYGHLSAFRTKLVVDKIVSVAAVPDSQPSDAVWAEPAGSGGPDPVSADLPRYPPLARRAGISGEVVIEVTVKEGRVASVEVKRGDRMLAAEAVANIHTWHFAAGADDSFTTTFVFQLERRSAGDQQPRMELHLPDSVRITAASYDW
jgi:TonB family protein